MPAGVLVPETDGALVPGISWSRCRCPRCPGAALGAAPRDVSVPVLGVFAPAAGARRCCGLGPGVGCPGAGDSARGCRGADSRGCRCPVMPASGAPVPGMLRCRFPGVPVPVATSIGARDCRCRGCRCRGCWCLWRRFPGLSVPDPGGVAVPMPGGVGARGCRCRFPEVSVPVPGGVAVPVPGGARLAPIKGASFRESRGVCLLVLKAEMEGAGGENRPAEWWVVVWFNFFLLMIIIIFPLFGGVLGNSSAAGGRREGGRGGGAGAAGLTPESLQPTKDLPGWEVTLMGCHPPHTARPLPFSLLNPTRTPGSEMLEPLPARGLTPALGLSPRRCKAGPGTALSIPRSEWGKAKIRAAASPPRALLHHRGLPVP